MKRTQLGATPAQWKTLPGPDDIYRTILPNGICLLVRSNFNSPSVVMSGYLACGSQLDPVEKLGLAHFTSVSLLRGTANRTFQQIFEALESAGASLGFSASVHSTPFGGRALAEDLPLLFTLLAEAVRQPVFPEDQVERLRGQILTSLAIRNQDTSERADLAFDEIVFANHPYGRPEDGHPETIQRITRDDLVAFHQQYYAPRGMVIVVVGAVSPEQVTEQAQQNLGDWQVLAPEPPVLPAILPLGESVRKHIFIPGKTQTDLVIGCLGPRRNAPEYLAASLGNNILGQFGMMGRIGEVVRERAGLAYHASTSLNSWITAGSWDVSAGVNPANLERAIQLIIEELRRFTREPVTLEELQDSQANFVGRLPLSLESNAGVANALLTLERFSLGLDYYREYPGRVQQVTPEAILEVARRYIDPDKLAIISAGPER
ncbi:MAG TPA: pitrilysin family protein [Anaerolineaceae bacterium]